MRNLFFFFAALSLIFSQTLNSLFFGGFDERRSVKSLFFVPLPKAEDAHDASRRALGPSPPPPPPPPPPAPPPAPGGFCSFCFCVLPLLRREEERRETRAAINGGEHEIRSVALVGRVELRRRRVFWTTTTTTKRRRRRRRRRRRKKECDDESDRNRANVESERAGTARDRRARADCRVACDG